MLSFSECLVGVCVCLRFVYLHHFYQYYLCFKDEQFQRTTFEKRGIGNVWGLHKIRGLAPLDQRCLYSLIIKPPPPSHHHHSWLPPPISSKNFPSPHYPFTPIIAIFEKFHPSPSFMNGGGRRGGSNYDFSRK